MSSNRYYCQILNLVENLVFNEPSSGFGSRLTRPSYVPHTHFNISAFQINYLLLFISAASSRVWRGYYWHISDLVENLLFNDPLSGSRSPHQSSLTPGPAGQLVYDGSLYDSLYDSCDSSPHQSSLTPGPAGQLVYDGSRLGLLVYTLDNKAGSCYQSQDSRRDGMSEEADVCPGRGTTDFLRRGGIKVINRISISISFYWTGGVIREGLLSNRGPRNIDN